jgi:hypothetical protein
MLRGNCSGTPPRGTLQGDLLYKNVLCRNSSPPHEVSKADSSTSRVPYQGPLLPKMFSTEMHLNSFKWNYNSSLFQTEYLKGQHAFLSSELS